MLSWVRLLRPKQWTKNLLVFAALLFSEHFTEADFLIASLLAFAAFSLAASSIYIVNDLLDVKEDRQHPVKRYRPIAAGLVGAPAALTLSALLGLAALAIAVQLDKQAAMLLGGYMLGMLLYSLLLKRILLLDVFIIAGGLTLRPIFGGVAIGVSISTWLLICAFFVSLMLALVKRRQELARLGDRLEGARRSLRKAPPVEVWDQWIAALAGITVLAYALYTVSPETVAKVGGRGLIWTTPVVVFAIFRYLAVVHTEQTGEDPADLLLADKTLMITVLVWLAVTLFVLTA